MSIDLGDFERGAPFDGDYPATLAALQERIGRAQLSQVIDGKRAIIVFEGPEGGGKADTLKLLAAALDPRFIRVHTILPDRRQSAEGHWLARFWRGLPEGGNTAVFFHSWYGRVLEDRALGMVDDSDWLRAFDEINEFEAQQRDYGTLLIKLYFHVADGVRDERLERRESDPRLGLLVGPPDLSAPRARAAYAAALDHMLKLTDTRWSPWVAIDANDPESANVAALTAIADALDRAFPDRMIDDETAVEPLHSLPESA